MRLGSLFAGIGGFDLAARWMGWETAWFSEIDPYASAVLAKHWPGVPNHGDITKIDFTQVESVDMLCGGFPCQDISNAGKRAGIEGSRSGLWGEYARAIRELRPRYVVVENVAALLGRGLERVLGDLAEIGYDAEWEILSAADVGAPHLRERVWVVAYPADPRLERHGRLEGTSPRQDGSVCRATGLPAETHKRSSEVVAHPAGESEPEPRHEAQAVSDRRHARMVAGGSSPRRSRSTTEPALGNTEVSGLEGERHEPEGSATRGRQVEPLGAGGSDHWGWATEPDVGRVANGVPSRVDRLKGLGNAIVPQCAFQIFQAIQQAEEKVRAA